MNIEEFINSERRRLVEDRQRLSARSHRSTSSRKSDSAKETLCPAQELINKNKVLAEKLHHKQTSSLGSSTSEKHTSNKENANVHANDRKVVNNQNYSSSTNISPSKEATEKRKIQQINKIANAMSSITTEEGEKDQSPSSFSLDIHESPQRELENAAALSRDYEDDEISLANFSTKTYSIEDLKAQLSKAAKDYANHKELSIQSEQNKLEDVTSNSISSKINTKKQDDMEQWVTDTFYSYFPGFNNELQKRQNYLRERQQEYQQNLLKHQMLQKNTKQNVIQKRNRQENSTTAIVDETPSNLNTSRSYPLTSHSTHKTDLEIINVNNPNYEPPKTTPRPGSTRHKLLQDLKHTDLANLVTGDAITERNRTNEELALARKKDYQRELMAQIEEKRRSIELIREKERRQDEALTRRLQEQLKTIQLEEELEKEKILAEKVRIETEQNRMLRAQMLAKLESDSKNLYKETKNKTLKINPETNKENTNMKRKTSSTSSGDNNKVYQYFSNSARHEYRRGHPLPEEIEWDLSIPEMKKTERECFHLCEKICPLCDEPLKSYESCCLRCQKQLSLKMSTKTKSISTDAVGKQENDAKTDEPSTSMEEEKTKNNNETAKSLDVIDDCRSSFSLLPTKNDSNSERSFEVLEVKYPEEKESDDFADSPPMPISSKAQIHNSVYNNLTNDNTHPPYSTNISTNSVFHPDYKLPSLKSNIPYEQLAKILPSKHVTLDLPVSGSPLDAETNIEKVRKETDRRLSRYMKNYADLARYSVQYSSPNTGRSKSESHSRSTQTTPETSARRDIVLQDANNLSMPLLREMPKMTRKESNKLLEQTPLNNGQQRIDNLKRRWEIPAVQKFTISPNSPRILTQVGAIRKQLQAEYLFEDDHT